MQNILLPTTYYLQPRCKTALLLELIGLQYLLVLIRIVHLEVVEQRAAACDFAEQTAAGGEILLMLLQVFGKQRYLFCEDRNLHLGRTGILIVCAMLLDKCFLDCTLNGHNVEGDEM